MAENKYLNLNGLQYYTRKLDEKKADIESPAFTGTPTAPTAAADTNTTQIATTEFVQSTLDNKLSVYGTEHTVNVRNMTETTAEIAPNTFYIWGEVEELNITLATPADETIYNEYMFQFTSGETATTLSLPDNITWYLGNNTILSNQTYQVSIVNNMAVLGEF